MNKPGTTAKLRTWHPQTGDNFFNNSTIIHSG